MACTAGCPTPGAHASWGECLRAKRTRVGWAASAKGLDKSRQDRYDADLDAYAAARAEGIQPMGTKRAQVEHAVKVSNETGTAFDAGSAGPLAL